MARYAAQVTESLAIESLERRLSGAASCEDRRRLRGARFQVLQEAKARLGLPWDAPLRYDPVVQELVAE